ncbi:MAG: hypothetical protein ACI8XO_001224 [Verrucomicrobiales bacterium]|jgi:hypothetical protein
MGPHDAIPSDSRQVSWQRALLPAWVAGTLVFQVPFQLFFKHGNGGFGYNILIGTALVVAGILLVAGITRLYRILSRSDRYLDQKLNRSTTFLLWLVAALLVTSLVLPTANLVPYLAGVATLLGWITHSSICILRSQREASKKPLLTRLFNRFRAVARQPWPFNGLFWLLVFITLVVKDLYTISDISGASPLEILALSCGRLVTNAAFTLALVLVVQALLALAPRLLRWMVLAAASVIPFIAISAFFVRQSWNKSLVEVFNDFTLSGRFDLTQELAASGIDITPLQSAAFLLLVAAACFGFFLLLQTVSQKLGHCRLRTVPTALAFGLVWLFTIAEQGLSMATKRTEIWQKEHKVFGVHFGLFSPPQGLETIPVELIDPQEIDANEQLLAEAALLPELERKPDIYILMVESWRSDSISEEITPFVYRFANTDCQAFEQTYAGSNCTPLSWFTLFHSRLALHWADTVKGAETPEGLPGAYPVRLLKTLGYKTSARAVCDLGYKSLGELNFGTDHKLADAFRDSNQLPGELAFPEREMIIVDELKKQVRQSQPGGHFHFIAFDSPHYNYYWPEQDFAPIHGNCDATINYTNVSPSPEQIIEVQKRYHNSVNWMDHQIEDFINFLKFEDRYDDATIIITGDHGEEFQEHGSWFHCSTLKKEQTNVPIMIKWPSWMETPIPQHQVSHLDIMPSLLDMLGLDEKYITNLSGNSVLREHPGETVISTIHRGTSNVGVSIIKDGVKANFTFQGLWEGGTPDKLFLANYTDLNDQPLTFLEERGELSHTEFLRQRYPLSTSRFFKSFGAPPEPDSEGNDEKDEDVVAEK